MKFITLKKTGTLILTILNLVACQSPAKISGTLRGIEKSEFKVYLIQPETLRDVAGSYLGKVIDSTSVDSEGRFEFHNLPVTEEAILFELAVQPSGKSPNFLETEDLTKSNYMPFVWQSGASILITSQLDELQKSFSIQNPSPVNKALLDLRDISQKAFQTFLAGKHLQLEDGKQLLEKEHAIFNYRKELMAFADSTQFFIPAMVALRWVNPVNDYERVPEFLVNQCHKWKSKSPEHSWIVQLCKQSEPSNLPVLQGDKFPNLELPMITKDTLSLIEQLGEKLTIIDLWASWCAPCRKENREILVPIWDEYHDQGLQIIAYALESDESAWKAAVDHDGANRWPQASDLQGDDAVFLKQIRVQTIPSNFILDDKGVVLTKNLHGKALLDWVKAYLNNE